jgi:hypothetical protein
MYPGVFVFIAFRVVFVSFGRNGPVESDFPVSISQQVTWGVALLSDLNWGANVAQVGQAHPTK